MKAIKILLFLTIAVLSCAGTANASNLFYVYGNDVFEHMPDGDYGYHPENYGSVFLGMANQTETFYGTYNYYILTSYAGDIALIDAFQGSDGTYLSSNITGNTPDYWNSWGAPDGVFAHVGEYGNGGFLVLDVTGRELTSIIVYSPAPFYCDDDYDGYYDSTSDGYCIGEGCIPSGCQAAAGDDCNDTPVSGAAIHPGASELCDRVDNNCNGEIDEGLEQENTISGTVYYSGVQTGIIHVAAVDVNNNFVVAAAMTIPEPGPYSLTIPPGTFYIVAQKDTNNSGSISLDSFQQNEPSGHYDAGCGNGENEDPIIFPNCALENIDIYVTDFNQLSILHDSFTADYFSGNGSDMGYHDGYLWICDQTWTENGPDIRKVNPANGNLVQSFNLNIDHATSLEWIGNDMWVCFKDYNQNSWMIRKYLFDGTTFTPGVSYNLPSSLDWNTVWSINIAWDGNQLWVQEKGHCVNIYKIDLSNGSIIETISADQFEYNKKVGLADIADICFSDGYLWGMDDGYPIFVQIDPANSQSINYTFDFDKYSFEEDGRYYGMVKYGDLFYFLQRIDIKDMEGNVVSSNYKILTASLDQCIFKTITIAEFAANFGLTYCDQAGACEGDGDFDGDIDGLDLWDILSCEE